MIFLICLCVSALTYNKAIKLFRLNEPEYGPVGLQNQPEPESPRREPLCTIKNTCKEHAAHRNYYRNKHMDPALCKQMLIIETVLEACSGPFHQGAYSMWALWEHHWSPWAHKVWTFINPHNCCIWGTYWDIVLELTSKSHPSSKWKLHTNPQCGHPFPNDYKSEF